MPEKKERNKEVLAMKQRGLSFRKIAKIVNLDKARVMRIVRKEASFQGIEYTSLILPRWVTNGVDK